MAKFSDKIGFTILTYDGDGIVTNVPTERKYVGDILRDAKRWQQGSQVNDDLVLSNRISVVADDFALSNLDAIKYVVFSGVKWKVTNFEFIKPRLILTLGGVYNG